MIDSRSSTGFVYPEEKLPPEIEQVVEDRLALRAFELISDALSKVLAEILSHANPGLTAAAIAYAGGVSIIGSPSEVELAARFGVTKQAFSRRVTEVSGQLGITPSRGMRSEAARKVFKEKQLCKPKSRLQTALMSIKSANSTKA